MRKKVVIAVAIVVVVILGVVYQMRHSDTANTSSTPSVSPAVAASSSGHRHSHVASPAAPISSMSASSPNMSGEGVDPDATPIATPSWEGHDDNADLVSDPAQQKKILTAAQQFAAGWLEPDAARRVAGITPVATENLTAKLSDPQIRIPSARMVGEPTVIRNLGLQAVVQQRLDNSRGLDMLLTYTPGARYEWLVTDIAPSR